MAALASSGMARSYRPCPSAAADPTMGPRRGSFDDPFVKATNDETAWSTLRTR